MEKTWRWFGRSDRITLEMLRQIGVEGIVTALHEVPGGEVWSIEAIEDLKRFIEAISRPRGPLSWRWCTGRSRLSRQRKLLGHKPLYSHATSFISRQSAGP